MPLVTYSIEEEKEKESSSEEDMDLEALRVGSNR